MIGIKRILSKINARIDSIQNEDKSKYPDDYKKHLSIEEAIYRRVRDELEFQSLSPCEKQAKRINSLASCRKTNADCSRKLLVIQIYEIITVSMPYLKVLNNDNRLSLLQELCLKELDLIDDNPLGDIKNHVSSIEIEEAFRPYFETVKPYRTEMLKECYEKIELLYKELIKLHEIKN